MGVPSKCTIVESKAVRAQAAGEQKGTPNKKSIVRIARSASVLQTKEKGYVDAQGLQMIT